MIALLILVTGPPLIAFAVLAVLPAGHAFLLGLVAVLTLWAIFAVLIYPIGPANGPDDWFHGVEVVPLRLTAWATAFVAAAQFWRWTRVRASRRTGYPAALGLAGLGFAVSAYLVG